jgi:SNF2 family DNA or RNA helicase
MGMVSAPTVNCICRWWRVVLDESQVIKNGSALVSKAAIALAADHRWCLSGTPLQNSVDDLASPFAFLRYAPYDSAAGFKALIKDRIAAAESTGFRLLQVLLQASEVLGTWCIVDIQEQAGWVRCDQRE